MDPKESKGLTGQVSTWINENGFELVPQKSTFLLINNHRARRDPYVVVGRRDIGPSKSISLLSLVFDEHMSILQPTPRMNLMRTLLGTNFAANQDARIRFCLKATGR